MLKRVTHICFADDDDDDLIIFSRAMTEAVPSVSLTSFYSCSDLLAFLADGDKPLPDMIFLDYNMPVIDGNKCLIMIKQTERLSAIPIIMFSTSRDRTTIDESYRNGAYKYIFKPNSFEELKTTLQKEIRRLELAKH